MIKFIMNRSEFFYRVINTSIASEVILTVYVMTMLNLPILLLSQKYFIIHPLINLDLIVVFLFRTNIGIGLVLLFLVWIADFIVIATMNYYFNNAYQTLNNFRFINLIELHQFITIPMVIAFIISTLILCIVINLIKNDRVTKRGILFYFIIVCMLDIFNGSMNTFFTKRDHFSIPFNIAGSPVMNLANSINRKWHNDSIPLSSSPNSIAFQAVKKWHKMHSNENVVVIIVESLGVPHSTKLKSWLEQQIFTNSIQTRWVTNDEIERFNGSTTSGELKVLCGLQGDYGKLDHENSANCLPSQFSKEGYNTIGFHGFSGQMFSRNKWWPIIGLNSNLFKENFITASACGYAFPGVCDNEIIRRAIELADKPRNFIYVLTLNTHLPLEYHQIPDDFYNLCRSEHVEQPSCQLVFQLGGTLRSIATSLEKVRRPPFVVIAGDHAPPFMNTLDRFSFSQKNIPVYILKPLRPLDSLT